MNVHGGSGRRRRDRGWQLLAASALAVVGVGLAGVIVSAGPSATREATAYAKAERGRATVVRPPSTPGMSMRIPGLSERAGSGYASNSFHRVRTGYTGSFNDLGEVRITCGVSHHAYDDPIVNPGQPGASHMHTFFGNAGVNASSTYQSLRNAPQGSTCAGGAVNKSAYWFPSLIDRSRNQVVEPTLTFVYYKTGYWGQDGRNVRDIPDGLRMVSGDAAARSSQADWNVNWSCSTHEGGVPQNEIRRGPAIQRCDQGQLLGATIMFPQCWNGRDLDSANHKSHMAHPSFNGSCPSTHPVLLPQITIHATWVMGSAGSSSLYLSNDMMTPSGAPAGQGLHADFFDGWDPASKRTFVDNCLNARRDCGVRALGDGYELLDITSSRGVRTAQLSRTTTTEPPAPTPTTTAPRPTTPATTTPATIPATTTPVTTAPATTSPATTSPATTAPATTAPATTMPHSGSMHPMQLPGIVGRDGPGASSNSVLRRATTDVGVPNGLG